MQKFINRQWQLAMEDFAKVITSVGMDLWITPLEPINIDEERLILVAPNEMTRETVVRSYLPKMMDAVKEHFNLDAVDIILSEDREAYVREYNLKHPDSQCASEPAEVTLQSPFNPRYTFENFVVGTTNQVIYAAARTVAESPASRFNPLFIYGGVGLGKTHLLHAIGNYIWEHKTGPINIVYVTCEKFTNDFVESIRGGREKGMAEFRKKYRQADILLIDDIQFISNKQGIQEEFFHTFNDLYQDGKQIIISSDRPPKEIAALEERLRSRFASGFIQDIQPPDFETRLLIIQKKIELEGYEFDHGLDYELADRLQTYNIREVEAILRKIYFYATLNGLQKATAEVMESVLDKMGEPAVENNNTQVLQRKIIKCVCDYFDISEDELVGRKRNKEIVEPRQICIYLMWKLMAIPLTTIGHVFSRDHTTIIHARDKILEQCKTGGPAAEMVSEITKKIKQKN